MPEETTATTEQTETTSETEVNETTETQQTVETTETQETTSDDWRAAITDPDYRKIADRFTSPADAVKSVADLRKQVSNSIRLPGADASNEDVAAYHKALGVPDAPDGYELVKPDHMTDEEFGVEAMTAQLTAFRAVMHGVHATPEVVTAAIDMFWKMDHDAKEAVLASDRKYADETDAALRREWPGEDFNRNKEHADRAATHYFGDALAEARNIETSDGRFILDHPILMKAFAAVGREMAEGRGVPPLNEDDRARVNDEIRGIRQQAAEAAARGDHKEANRLYQKEQEVIAKTQGNQPIVGAQGRAA